MVYESENSTTCSIKLKWGSHFEKKNVMFSKFDGGSFPSCDGFDFEICSKIRLQISFSCKGPWK
jgi:hypothetical protein